MRHQKDLFDSSAEIASSLDNAQAAETIQKRFHVTLSLDQLLFVVIGTIVVFSVLYGAGFETGRRIERSLTKPSKNTSPLEGASSPQPSTPQTLTSTGIEKTPAADSTAAVSQEEDASSQPDKKPVLENAAEVSAAASSQGFPLHGNYTIQVVTYQKKATANQKKNALIESGYTSFVFPTGKYLNVCVNGFKSKKQAEAFLKDLKQKGIAPKDAYVRNMPSNLAG